MKLDLKKKLVAKSAKVKSVDFHPTYPWVLIGLYNGSISIYDYNTQASLQYVEVTSHPIRSAKFLADKNLIICGSDDKKIRVFNYNTMEKIKEIDAHSDFIRDIAVHSKEALILSCSDDQTICLWDVEKSFQLVRTYDEHKNFVMRLAVNTKDVNMFASASMDNKIKIWSFTGKNSHMTLEGHKKGVTCVAFCPMNDKPFLASGSDDMTVKIWDYTNKHCLYSFEGHENNISAVCFHQDLPILVTGAEDMTCKFWNINTFKLEESKIFGYDTIWDITAQPAGSAIAIGCEEGTVVFKLGSESPLASFNSSQAKIIYAKQNTIYAINLKQIAATQKDGDIVDISAKSLGTTELYPIRMTYSPNGRYFSILSDKEFVISTSGVYRSSCVGNCTDISWNDGESFVTKEGSNVKIFKELKESKSFKPGFTFDNVLGGPYIGVKTSDAVFIYDNETATLIRKIDVAPFAIVWSENKSFIALLCEDVTYILKVNLSEIEKYVEDITENGEQADEEGCADAFEPIAEINDKVLNGVFIEDVFLFVNTKNKINYIIDEQVFNITTLNGNWSLQGYLPSTNKIYLMNKSFELITFTFPISFVNYQIAIFKKNYPLAEKIYPDIPSDYLEKVTNFLEKFEHYEISFNICQNPNQKFSLALKLKKLLVAWNIAKDQNCPEKFKHVADLALELGEFRRAEEAMLSANDYQGLLLYYSCTNDRERLITLAECANTDGVLNIAFCCYFQLNNLDKCVEVLLNSGKIPEAALFCRTYCPSKLGEIINRWNELVENDESNSRISIKIVNPLDHLDPEKMTALGNIAEEFYHLVKVSDFSNSTRLSSFNDVDLDALLLEKEGNVDLKSLLEIR